MGVNVDGAYLAFHLRPSSTIDDYIEECGCSGRTSANRSHAALLKYSGCTQSWNIFKGMKKYEQNSDKYRRSLLISPFLTN